MKRRRGGIFEAEDTASITSHMEDLFTTMNGMLSNNRVIDTSQSGSTGTLLLMKGKKLVCANIGDSTAYIISKTHPSPNEHLVISTPISTNHTPYIEEENSRIVSKGGEVRSAQNQYGESSGPLRVFKQGSKIPGLMMTRCFGDKIGQSCGIVSTPGRDRLKQT